MPRKYDRKDRFYQQAKEEGFRSRAAYKLQELDKRFKLLRRGGKVLDLGCWPGGWTQVACRQVGPSGYVAGIDLVETKPFSPAELQGGCAPVLFCADATRSDVLEQLQNRAGSRFELILSDMSAKLTGIRFADVARSAELLEFVFAVSQVLLKDGGNVVAKFFPGQETEEVLKTVRSLFSRVARVDLDSSRKTSTEQYFVGLGYKTAKK